MTIIVRDPSVGQGPVVRSPTAGATIPTRDLILPRPPEQYDPSYERDRNRIIEEHRHRGTEYKLLLQSPNGAFWSVVVDNAGALSAVAV